MAPPPLKRQKTNPTEESQPQPTLQEQAQQAANVPLPPDTPRIPSSTPREDKRSSWLARTWPRKAPPLTQTHRESVSSASSNSPLTSQPAAQEGPAPTRERAKMQRSPSLAMTLGKSTSNRSLPINATTTIVNATSGATASSTKANTQSGLSLQAKDDATVGNQVVKDDQRPEKTDETSTRTLPDGAPIAETSQPDSTNQTLPEPQSMWLSWLPGKKDGVTAKPAEAQGSPPRPKLAEASEVPPGNDAVPDPAKTQPEVAEQPQQSSVNATNKRSWYQMWSSNDPPAEVPKQDEPASESGQSSSTGRIEATEPATAPTKHLDILPLSTPKPKDSSQASSLETSPPPALHNDGSKSGWVFWSREKKRPESIKSESEPRVGEIAISDTPSQARPKRASISLQDEAATPALKPSPQEIQSKKAVAQRNAEPKQQVPTEQSLPGKAQKSLASKQDPSRTTKASSSTAAAIAKEPRPASPAPSLDKRKEDTNLLLPLLHDTLTHEEQPSLIQQLARLLYYTREPDAHQHLSLIRDPPRIKHALAIGVHGYFPAPMVRSILGQPTGTSIKFAEKAAQNIRRYTASQGYDCEVKTAALEGEGRIAERVELLWKLLLNWIDEIRRSDFILIAAHSQGVPVAIMLIAKLIHFGCLSPAARVGVCAMAGVNIGPFQDYKSPWITGSAGELFEFTNPHSKVSTDYLAAISDCLQHGVKVTFVGSIDDQLVSMESSIFAPLTHPHIYRAVSIDSRIHAPNFLSNLVGFVLKLRNVGVPDHGLIRELSAPLAGSLYTGEGHSRLYEDDAVYALAIAFTLETTSLPHTPITSSKRAAISVPSDGKAISSSGSQTSNSNPYILPFAMRGILEEDIVKKDLREEAKRLLEQFDEWEPKTKVLKDVKFRLEGVRSQLL
ncbi:hypothetical protein A1O7_08827 [Cladophialophora yegresii CBS 114405]|uniref:YMC020W-like alpha/beta hydrolase domain-containing protein n=1 Tax=Cladophialophora yegresii CBS 114405 TaxID=1182544 RepID=W9VUT1_9EURO|nr:uncharacterized protein A1O7_08827 [Cladophialophora yegresii CBS 114405]EXJ55896.1 hypothetical protein A1O7_08827 [Cladophialophora yegresii CBS 114405]